MKKSHLLILSIFLIAVATSCKKHDPEVTVPAVKVPKMKTLLSQQWKLTGFRSEFTEVHSDYSATVTDDFYGNTFECLRNSPVVFNPDGTGTITTTCEYLPKITTEWKFSVDSATFFFKWNDANLTTQYYYNFQTFCADSIVLTHTDTTVSKTTLYKKYIYVLKKNN
jgi:hypothetical protein